MALHNVLPFPVRVAPLAGRRERARRADVIPFRRYRWRRHPWRESVRIAIGAVLLWGVGIVLWLAAFGLNRDWLGEVAPAWAWWPIW